jgi:serine/threonine protein kinase
MIKTNKTRKNMKLQKINKTKKYLFILDHVKDNPIEKLHKCSRSRITGMESYKINCGKNMLLGYHTIKGSEETSSHKDDFVYVVLSILKDYDKPVVVKVYDEQNFHLHIELKIIKIINDYRNTAKLICDFSCNDDKTKYITTIKKQLRFCGNSIDKLHFFVYEYISNGDISVFLSKNQDIEIIKSIILQITCVIIQLASIYKIYHGDINSGNILIDTISKEHIEYCIENEIFIIKTHGYIPKMIDYGRSNLYKGNIINNEVWFDIILMLGVVYPYIQDVQLKQKILEISKKTELNLPFLKNYFTYIREML